MDNGENYEALERNYGGRHVRKKGGVFMFLSKDYKMNVDDKYCKRK